jgi:ribosomal-protein-alanine N-acetyltransferase
VSAEQLPGAAETVVLRPAGQADEAEIASLEQEAFGDEAWTAAAVAQEISAPGRRTLVAVGDARLLGYAVTWTTGEVADLQRVVVSARARRRGVASRLLRALLADAAATGVRRVLLEVSEHNAPALALYARSGFREIDRRARYYRDGSDAVVLQLDLTAGLPPTETGEETS